MIRTPLRPLARILRAREKGENPDEIEAETQSAETALRRKMLAYAAFGFANPNAYRLIYMTRPGEAGSAEDAVSTR